jgi:hypothetical protein
LLLTLAAVFLFDETQDPVFAFLVTCGIACIFPGSAGFTDVKGWADIVPYGLILVSIVFRQPWIIFFSLFFAGLGDERALLSSLFVVFWWVWKSDKCKHPFSQLLCNHQIHAVMLAWMAFVLVRWMLVFVFQFETRLGVVGSAAFLSLPIEYFLLGFWSSFEAFWLVIPAVFLVLWLGKDRYLTLLFALALGLNVAGAFLIHDVTKSLGYSLVGVMAGMVLLYRETGLQREMRMVMGMIALICVVAPTQYIYGSHWLYAPFPMWVFQWLKEWVLALRG